MNLRVSSEELHIQIINKSGFCVKAAHLHVSLGLIDEG